MTILYKYLLVCGFCNASVQTLYAATAYQNGTEVWN